MKIQEDKDKNYKIIRKCKLQEIDYYTILQQDCPYDGVVDALEVRALGFNSEAYKWFINLWDSIVLEGFKWDDNPNIEIDVDYWIYIPEYEDILRKQMNASIIKLKCLRDAIDLPPYEPHLDDLDVIVNVCENEGYFIPILEAHKAWVLYSRDYLSNWKELPHTDEEVLDIILAYTKEI